MLNHSVQLIRILIRMLIRMLIREASHYGREQTQICVLGAGLRPGPGVRHVENSERAEEIG